MWRSVDGWRYFQSLRAKLDPDFETNAHLKRPGWHNRLRSGLLHGHEDEPDVEELQGAGTVHRARCSRPGNGGQMRGAQAFSNQPPTTLVDGDGTS